MVIFNDIQDVETWLAPLDYVALWDAAAPYAVFTEDDREHCDGLIAAGTVAQHKILAGLKIMVRVALSERFDLHDRIYDPVDRQYLRRTH
ncbi:hypothetical protein [Thalassococcus sp. S3]|uniref:hypothetical protein n=1 Tax=Thalassococcus sp. S3 TaxID=2017482 RepID=UPI00102401D9|nr:hypothetical protein [Thalassococcus sp. S3]QBF32347.1 hypothetical protein CFI11_14150 [Thalassococcus sp. S3]